MNPARERSVQRAEPTSTAIPPRSPQTALSAGIRTSFATAATVLTIHALAPQLDTPQLYATLSGGLFAMLAMPFLFVAALGVVSVALVVILTPIALVVGRGRPTGFAGLLVDLARIPLPIVPRYFVWLGGGLRSPALRGCLLGVIVSIGSLRSTLPVA